METIHPSHHHRRRRRPRILLGVTGSVAAIKAPELAVQIVSDYKNYYYCEKEQEKGDDTNEVGGCDLQIVLTKSGEYFWDRAAEYNPQAWKKFQQLSSSLQKQPSTDESSTDESNSTPPLSGIPIHRTCCIRHCVVYRNKNKKQHLV
jgi:hypothetical protein